MIILNNKWTKGKVCFDMKYFDPRILRAEGILPLPVCLSEETGTELALFYIDHSPYIYELERMRPFNMDLKSGLGKTSHGPILFHLFSFYTENSAQPVLLVDTYANPLNHQHISTWRDLSRQSHWHLFLVNGQGEQVGFFEFPNTFDLGQTLDLVSEACRNTTECNFIAAKEDFCNRYTVEELDELN